MWFDLPNRMQDQNQDGFHFLGPGQFLTIRNVGGCVGDDFMNIGPDECDKKSSITDVLVDGVFLNDADQAIRLLSRDKGRLDRITIRNVSGTYRSFGFYINAWFEDSTYGNFGNILIENIDLCQTKPNYTYRPPMLFSIGGNIECITFKNIRHHNPYDNRTIFELGLPFYQTSPATIDNYEYQMGGRPKLQTIIIDGLTVIENGEKQMDIKLIELFDNIENLIIKNIVVLKNDNEKPSGYLLNLHKKGSASKVIMSDVYTVGLKGLINSDEKIIKLISYNVTDNNSILKEF